MGEKRENKGEEIKGKKRQAEILPEVSSSSQSLLISFPWVGDPANKNKDLLPPPPLPSGPKSADSGSFRHKNNGGRERSWRSFPAAFLQRGRHSMLCHSLGQSLGIKLKIQY